MLGLMHHCSVLVQVTFVGLLLSVFCIVSQRRAFCLFVLFCFCVRVGDALIFLIYKEGKRVKFYALM